MFELLQNLIQQALQNNQFFSGGLLLGALGFAGSIIYKIVPVCKRVLERKYLVKLEIRDPVLFEWTEEWLQDNFVKTKNYNRLSVSLDKSRTTERGFPRLLFSPGRGTHFFHFNGRIVVVSRQKEESPSDKNNQASSIESLFNREYFSLKTIGRNPECLKSIIKDVQQKALERTENKLKVFFHSGYGSWSSIASIDGRELNSVVLRKGLKKEIVSDAEEFIESEDMYKKLGIPYRRGYLLYGPPGTGKSSIAKALASHLSLNLYSLSLSGRSLTDENLHQLFNDAMSRSIILIEDIDKAFNEREKDEDNNSKVTFSGLLNVLDGVASQEGRILIMTTNHPERLDDALVRPGRIDVKYYIGMATKDQAERLFLRFFEETLMAKAFSSQIEDKEFSPAEIQNYLFTYRKDPEKAVGNVNELREERDKFKDLKQNGY